MSHFGNKNFESQLFHFYVQFFNVFVLFLSLKTSSFANFHGFWQSKFLCGGYVAQRTASPCNIIENLLVGSRFLVWVIFADAFHLGLRVQVGLFYHQITYFIWYEQFEVIKRCTTFKIIMNRTPKRSKIIQFISHSGKPFIPDQVFIP